MPSTHTSLHFHLIFSTKNRVPLIERAWRDRLHAYLGGTVRTVGGTAESVGGVADHVHLLVGLRPTHCLSDVLREIKHASSQWVHETIGMKKFSWQDGYGAFTVSVSNIERVKRYIADQERHHRRRTFQGEYVQFLKRNRIEYDERYLW